MLKLPKRAQRRRTRLRASAIGLLFLAALGAAGAYFISSKTKLFGSEPAEPSFIEATPAAEPSATPTPVPAATPTPAAAPTVTIKDTETGYLNVRASAGTTAAILTKINPGDSYELLEENEAGDWYKIKIDDDTAGWIAARYATKNNE